MSYFCPALRRKMPPVSTPVPRVREERVPSSLELASIPSYQPNNVLQTYLKAMDTTRSSFQPRTIHPSSSLPPATLHQPRKITKTNAMRPGASKCSFEEAVRRIMNARMRRHSLICFGLAFAGWALSCSIPSLFSLSFSLSFSSVAASLVVSTVIGFALAMQGHALKQVYLVDSDVESSLSLQITRILNLKFITFTAIHFIVSFVVNSAYSLHFSTSLGVSLFEYPKECVSVLNL